MRVATLQIASDTTGEASSRLLEMAISATSVLFEDFIAIDSQLLQEFSNIEWNRLIHVFINCFRLISIALGRPGEERISHGLAQIATNFQRLTIRMKENLSTDDMSNKSPSMFLLFDSVLPVMTSKYTKMLSRLPVPDVVHPIQSRPPSSLASLCPIANGSVKNTEYWDTLIDANADNLNLSEGLSFEDSLWMQELDGLGGLSSLLDQDSTRYQF